MSEQVQLFLKSEQADLAQKSLHKILFEIPAGILITKFSDHTKVRFYNEQLLELLKSFYKPSEYQNKPSM